MDTPSISQHGGDSTSHITLPMLHVTYEPHDLLYTPHYRSRHKNKTANPSYETLSKVRSTLDFVLGALTRGKTCGMGVGQPGHRKKSLHQSHDVVNSV